MEKPYFIQVLQAEFGRRKKKNSSYSMRAFAGSIGVHASSLSRVLAGKEDLAPKAALCVASKMTLAKIEKRLFLQSVVETRKDKEMQRLGEVLGAPELRPSLMAVEPRDCAAVFNVEAHALLQLTLTPDFTSNTEFIVQRLGITAERAEDLIVSLVRFGLLRRENGVISNAQTDFTTVQNAHTDELRKSHQIRILELAAQSVRDDDFAVRANYGVAAAIDPRKIPAVREKILRFLESLAEELELGTRSEVYQFNFNVFPLSHPLAGSL